MPMHLSSSNTPTTIMNTSNDGSGFSFNNNFDGMNGNNAGGYSQSLPQHQQQNPSPQVGGGVIDNGQNGLSLSNNLNLVQSILQGTQGQGQFSQDVQVQGGNYGGHASNNSDPNAFWQSCRFCQQKFCLTPERLFEHEISCPMHLQVQQFLQQQNFQQQQQNQLQQLQQQQQQQGQFNSQQSQFEGSAGGMFDNAGGWGNISGYGNQVNADHQGSSHNHNLGLLSQLSQQQQDSHQYDQVSSSNNANDDQFESAINRLPEFHHCSSQQQHQQVVQHNHHSASQSPSEPQAPRPEPEPLCMSPPGSSTDYFPLSTAEDEEWLTPLHCFVRKYCVEVFVATPEDVAAPCMGKRNPVSVSQVGIRCPYCSPERMGDSDQVDVARARENGVVYPSLISRIYNSSINLLQRHLRSCAFVPPEVIQRYEELKSSNARSGASKKYWADSAARLGLVDTRDGIRLDGDVHAAYRAAVQSGDAKRSSKSAVAGTAASLQPDTEAPPLVLPSDKRNTTAFTFHLMSQMQPCVFTEADRLGRRRGLDVGFAGLACRHCFGVYGSGRFFPSSVKTMADASKTLDVIYRHVMKCKNCPCDIKGGLRNLRDFHDSERSKMPFGNQRAFFVKIWGRLHEGSGDLVRAQACPNNQVRNLRQQRQQQQQAAPRPMPPLPAGAVAAMAPAMAAQASSGVHPGGGADVKLGAVGPTPSGESLHGLYAMVKRENSGANDQSRNKLVNEAA